MSNFKLQIEEDIREYQEKYKNIKNIEKDEWAFNYWILDKFFFQDQELIEEKIIDYKDLGIDAYEFYPQKKDLYLIQNKYYSKDTLLSVNYVENNFLLYGITALEKGTYKRSKKLQNIFNKYKKNPEFKVFLQLYVTNNNRSPEVDKCIKKFNKNQTKYFAKIFYLDDIEERYYEGEIRKKNNNFQGEIEVSNKESILNANLNLKEKNKKISGRYMIVPVESIYKLYQSAKAENYAIFDKNIREYLGNKGAINKKIYDTLKNDEKSNFLFYNNGITIICDKVLQIKETKFKLVNPQIVNGCQTVNSIYEALNSFDDDSEELSSEYAKTFIMIKVLEIDSKNEEEEELYKNIVRYNNSQNAIDERIFNEDLSIFKRLFSEFIKKGFLLLIKQSDKHQFKEEYKNNLRLKDLASKRMEKFQLSKVKRIEEVFIEKDRLMQVILAYVAGGYSAYKNKSKLKSMDSREYEQVLNFIKDSEVTNDTLLDLYLLYKKSESNKRKSSDKRTPISYYLIDGFAKYECKNRKPKNILTELETKKQIKKILDVYSFTTKQYTKQFTRKNDGMEYNNMIKKEIDYDIFKDERERALDYIEEK